MKSTPACLMVALIPVLVLLGCSTREPTNPLDPDNPDTGGAPRWLTALADDQAVDLFWSVPRFEDVDSVRVIDRLSGTAVWAGTGGANSLRVGPLPNGLTRRYRIELSLDNGSTVELPDVSAEPGPAVAWVLDAGSGRASRMTPDARDLRLDLPILDARSLRADPEAGTVLLVDLFGGSVSLFDRDGMSLWENDGFDGPIAAAHDLRGWWVADPIAGTVTLLDKLGAVLAADSTFSAPVELASGTNGRVWVAENVGAVALLDPEAGVVAGFEAVTGAAALASDGAGGVWIAEPFLESLLHVSAEGELLAELGGYPGIVSMVADPVIPGGVWLSDRALGQVRLIDATGETRLRLDEVMAPSRAVVSPNGEEIWIADPEAQAVLRYNRSGDLLVRSRALAAPITIAVAFEPAAETSPLKR